MTSREFAHFRKRLAKTQKQMAELIGSSLKAVHSYEQGWRKIPSHVERQVLFLVSRHNHPDHHLKACWIVNRCPAERKATCPAWEFKAGRLCWFVNGTICDGKPQKNWNEKIKICRSCRVFNKMI